MPIGVIVNVVAVIVGGIVGTLIGPRLSENFKNGLNTIFGACAMTMGISSIVLMENMPAELLHLIENRRENGLFSVIFGGIIV